MVIPESTRPALATTGLLSQRKTSQNPFLLLSLSSQNISETQPKPPMSSLIALFLQVPPPPSIHHPSSGKTPLSQVYPLSYSSISQHGFLQPPSWAAMPLASCLCGSRAWGRPPPPFFHKCNENGKKNSPQALLYFKRGLQICLSSVELTSVRSMNIRVKGKCEK